MVYQTAKCDEKIYTFTVHAPGGWYARLETTKPKLQCHVDSRQAVMLEKRCSPILVFCLYSLVFYVIFFLCAPTSISVLNRLDVYAMQESSLAP